MTPNDGSVDGPIRFKLNLFQTDVENSPPTQPGALSASVVTTSTATTSQPLSSLTSDKSYDVRVTPNDGTEDGPSRTTLNLFQTDIDVDLIFRDSFETK